jgi:ankyrin repeat protein
MAGELTRVLLAAGAPVDGPPGRRETPLITAASYGEPEMARALIEAGADLEATGVAVPGGTALSHAVAFGNSAVVDVLVAAGAVVHDLAEAAGAGDVGGWLAPDTPAAGRVRALRAAAVCERLSVIDLLLEAGTPVDAETDDSGPTALHWAAYEGKPRAVRHLLARGADPNRREREHGSTPLGWCRFRHGQHRAYAAHGVGAVSERWRFAEVERILEPLASEPPG